MPLLFNFDGREWGKKELQEALRNHKKSDFHTQNKESHEWIWRLIQNHSGGVEKLRNAADFQTFEKYGELHLKLLDSNGTGVEDEGGGGVTVGVDGLVNRHFNASKKKEIISILRNEIKYQTDKKRAECDAVGNHNLHVGHGANNTLEFTELVEKFKIDNNLNWDTIGYQASTGEAPFQQLKDRDLARRWRSFHAEQTAGGLVMQNAQRNLQNSHTGRKKAKAMRDSAV